MRITTATGPAVDVPSPFLALGIFDGETNAPAALNGLPTAEVVARLLGEKEVGTAPGDVTILPGLLPRAGQTLVLLGLGAREKFDGEVAYLAGIGLAKRLASKPRESVALVPPDASRGLSALIEGIVVGTRGPGLRKSESSRHPFGELVVVSEEGEALLSRAAIIGEAVNLARDLANTPPSEKSPVVLAERFRAIAEEAGLGVEVWGEDRLREEKFGGVLGVAAGSANPPAFVVLRYRKGEAGAPIALVGKGVTFDSGGLSLKPTASMEDMKSDMTGAAVVVSTMQAIARLGVPANLVGYLPLTENMTGGKALKLGDVLTMRNGVTVEILNTDAEGRLILADALSYAVESKPAKILDLATLTGACMVALGTKIAGLFSPDDAFAGEIQVACRKTGERSWRMPLDDDFDALLKSPVADCKNVGGKWGGAISAARFLKKFVGDIPWLHLDIAGPSWAENDSPTRDAGGTGCYVRTLIEWISPTA